MRDDRLVTVVIGVRISNPDGERRRNFDACLATVTRQDCARRMFRVVLVEQDAEPRLRAAALPHVDEYLFAYNPGPYNRGWGLNVGAVGSRDGVLCLLDADLLVPADFIAQGWSAWQSGALAIRPFTRILYLDERSTEAALAQLTKDGRVDVNDPRHTGHTFFQSQGGCLWIDARVYHRIGGHDERFEGWGREDREFWTRLAAVTPIVSLAGRLLHLAHARDAERHPSAENNRRIFAALASGELPTPADRMGDIDRYRGDRRAIP